MLQLIKKQAPGMRTPAYAAFVLAFASFGDAFLYPFLPQYGGLLGIPVVWIGFLLAINRLVRIAFNPVVPQLFARFGVRHVTIVASFLAVVSTFGYGLNWGFVAFALFRIVWGISFAILRTGMLAYAIDDHQPGKAIGVAKSIQEVGPAMALWIGPLLLNILSPPYVFFMLAAFSIPSMAFAFRLPEFVQYRVPPSKLVVSVPSRSNMITFIVSFIAEGIIVVTAGLLLCRMGRSYVAAEITLFAAGYLAYRRLCSILLSPVAGILADRFGFATIFNGSVAFITVGLIFVLGGWIEAGLIIIFGFNSVNSAMAPGGVAANASNKISAISVNATWRDSGVATGTLVGGVLLTGNFLYQTILITTFILTILLLAVYAKK